MLEQLLNSEQGNLFDLVKNFQGIDNQHNEAATNIVKDTIVSSLSNQAKSGDLSGILEMFSGSQTNGINNAASSMSNDIVSNLVSKLGINPSQASGFVQMAMPIIMNMFNNKVQNAKSSGFDVASLIGQFAGGNSGSGIDAGSVSSLISMFTNGGNSSSNSNDGFGLDDVINIGKKLF
ncbi:MAG: DUF937 domain-containing protein [Cytophagales bacterium]